MSLSIALLLTVHPRFAVATDEPIDGWKDLEKAIIKETAKAKTDHAEVGLEYSRENMGAALLAHLRSTLRRGDRREVDGTLDQIDVTSTSSGVRDATARIRAALETRRAEKDKAIHERISRLVEDTRNVVRSAKTAADLDQIILKLSEIGRSSEGSDSAHAESKELSKVCSFALRWQEYLSSHQAGDQRDALDKLRTAVNVEAGVLPRSELLGRVAEEERSMQARSAHAGGEVVEKLQSLNDIPAAIRELENLQRGLGKSNQATDDQVVALRNELLGLQSAYQCFQAGLPTQIQLSGQPMSGNPGRDEAYRLMVPSKMMLIRLALPRLLGTEKTLPLANEETTESYFQRVIADAEKRLDAVLIIRVKGLQNAIAGLPNKAAIENALIALTAGVNQDEAGQFMLAVVSYQNALRSGSDAVPAKVVGARLDAIKTAHAADFTAGMKFVSSNGVRPPMYEPPISNFGTGGIMIPARE